MAFPFKHYSYNYVSKCISFGKFYLFVEEAYPQPECLLSCRSNPDFVQKERNIIMQLYESSVSYENKKGINFIRISFRSWMIKLLTANPNHNHLAKISKDTPTTTKKRFDKLFIVNIKSIYKQPHIN